MVYVKADDLDPDAAKFVHDFRGSMYKRFAQKGRGKQAKNCRHLLGTACSFAFGIEGRKKLVENLVLLLVDAFVCNYLNV